MVYGVSPAHVIWLATKTIHRRSVTIPILVHTHSIHRQRTSIRAMSSSHPPSQEHKDKNNCSDYGSWESPITAQVVAGSCKRVNGFAVAGDGRLLWVESRPNEGGYVVCSFHRSR